jgi:hypothetical protein
VHMPRHSAVARGMSRRGLRASSAPLAIMSKPTYLQQQHTVCLTSMVCEQVPMQPTGSW